MKIVMVNEKLAVEKVGKPRQKESEAMFAGVNIADSMGVIKYAFKGSKFEVGQRVYYGIKREEIRMSGTDVQVMGEENIVAIVEDDNEEQYQ